MGDQQHHESSTNPSDEERERVDDLPTGAGSGDEPEHQDPTSGGAPEHPDA
mgnify:CR=1 FL=1